MTTDRSPQLSPRRGTCGSAPASRGVRLAIRKSALAGRGAMSRVYRGRDRRTGRAVAPQSDRCIGLVDTLAVRPRGLKTEPPASGDRQLHRARGSDGDSHVAMEWLEGPTPASRLASQGAHRLRDSNACPRLETLAHAHSASSIATSSQPICCSSEGESTTSRSSISVLLATSSTRARSRARARSWEHRDTWYRSRPSESGPSIHVRTFSRSDVLFRCLAGRSAFDAACSPSCFGRSSKKRLVWWGMRGRSGAPSGSGAETLSVLERAPRDAALEAEPPPSRWSETRRRARRCRRARAGRSSPRPNAVSRPCAADASVTRPAGHDPCCHRSNPGRTRPRGPTTRRNAPSPRRWVGADPARNERTAHGSRRLSGALRSALQAVLPAAAIAGSPGPRSCRSASPIVAR